MINAPNIQWRAGDGWLTGDFGTEALGVKDISPLVPDIIVATENFETDPIPGVGGGNLPWLPSLLNPHSGLRCFRSGVILANQQSLWTFTVPATATALRFWHRVSSEAGFDFFEVYRDSVAVPNRLFQLSGTANVWAQTTVNLAGATTVIIRYVKDGSSSVGLDSANVDDFEWLIPGSPAVQNYEPLHLDTSNQLKVKDPSLDVPLSTMATEATLAAFQAENDANLNAANASLDVIEAGVTGATVKFARLRATLIGDTTIVAAVPGKKIRVLGYMVTCLTAGAPTDLFFKSGALTDLGSIRDFDGLYPVSYAGGLDAPAFETAVGQAFVVGMTLAKSVDGHICYVEI